MPGERTRGRRSSGPELVHISWRDLPAQVNAKANGETGQYILPRRFQKGIDRAAMVAGRKSASDYVAEWQRSSTPIDLDAAIAAGLTINEIARREGKTIETAFPMARIDEYVRTGGWSPDRLDLNDLLAADAAAREARGEAAVEPPPDDEDEDEDDDERDDDENDDDERDDDESDDDDDENDAVTTAEEDR